MILFFVLLGIAIYHKLNKTEILIALSFFFISIISSGLLTIASYLPERSLANGIVFLLPVASTSCSIITWICTLRMYLSVCLHLSSASSLMSYWEGSYDIYRVHKEQAVRECSIENSVIWQHDNWCTNYYFHNQV